jgi:hemerythrin-like metal-binding protein
MLGMPKEQIIGQSHQAGYIFDVETKANYDIFWGDLRRGKSKHQINKVVYNTQEFWVDETYTPIISQTDGKPYKILKIGFDITEQKLKEIKMQEQAEQINKESEIIEEYKTEIENLKEELKKTKKQLNNISNNKKSNTDAKSESESIIYDVKASGNNLLDWTDKFLFGIEDVDEQHKQLIELVNSMFASFKMDKTKKEIKENIKSFVDFASYHFGNEEQYFEQFNYSESKSHIKEHNEFLKQIKSFQIDYNTNKVKFLDDIMSYIKVWLYRHFTEEDIKFVELFKLNGL